MPNPKPNEKEDDYISRCVEETLKDGTTDDPKQAAAICYSKWRERAAENSMSKTQQSELIAAIRARKGKEVLFGIKTADRYVQSLAECVGPGMCQKYFGQAQKSFSLLLKEAADKLTYAGADLEIQEKLATNAATIKQIIGDDELPQHTMMAFTHVLTTPREDRDGDILLTEGARVDPKMPLLWQHVHTLPIGKAIKVIEQSPKILKMASVLLDVNELTHDAGILLEADALRFSHGFAALDFAERNKAGGMGFEVKLFDVMEESLVSVPSNIDAEVDLLGKRKLKSEVFKAHAEFLRRNMRQKRSVHAGVEMPKVTYTEQMGEYKRTIKAGSFAELKEGLALVGAGDQRRDAATAAGAGHQHDHKTPCGCGGKAKAVGGPPRDVFDNQTDADSRAEVLGCDWHHQIVGPGGKVMFRPCRTPDEYDTYAQGQPASALPIPPARQASATPTGEKVWMDGSSLEGSYLHRISDLQMDAQRFLMGAGMDVDVDDFVSVYALFDGYGILCVAEGFAPYEWGPSNSGEESYYQATWAEENGEPKWTGVPTPIEIKPTLNISETAERHVAAIIKIATDQKPKLSALKFTWADDAAPKQNKVGRVLSTANLQRLTDALDDLKHLRTLDIPREASAMIDRVLTTLGAVVDAASNGEDQQPKAAPPITAKEAAAIVLQCADAGLQRKLADALSGILRVYREDEKAAEFKKLLRR